MKKQRIKKMSKKGQIIVNLLCILLCIITVAPFLLVVTSSLTNEDYILENGYSFLIKAFDLSAYKYVFGSSDVIFRAYGVTGLFSFLAMVGGLIMMSMVAYPLSRSNMPAKKFISFILYFTMLFNGGLVPTYILNTQYLHLDNTLLIYILPTLVNAWHVFMIRTAFQGLPQSVIESAYMDGASEYTILAKIAIPMSTPVLATVALMTFLGKWNDWYTCMLYIDDDKLTSLQYLLQKIILDIQMLKDNAYAVSISPEDIPGEGIRLALAVVVAGPALLVFPFFQKYFTKGMTVGAVKG